MPVHLLLLSNSSQPGMNYLEHAMDALQEFLDGQSTIHFVPYALANYDGYTAGVARALAPSGIIIKGVHIYASPRRAIEEARVLFVGGGNRSEERRVGKECRSGRSEVGGARNRGG